MEHLVVAFDATPAACSAAQWAFGLAALHRSRVSLVRVEPPGASSSEEARHRVRDAAVEQAQLALDAGRPPASVGFVDRPDAPYVDAAALAADLDADLLVVGTAGPDPSAPPPAPPGNASNGRVGAPDLVRTVRGALEEGATPVAVIPIGTPPPDGRTHWLVAVDGSPADRATLWFARLATTADAGVGSPTAAPHPRVTAVLAYQPSADTFPHPAEPAWTYPGELEARRHLDDIGPADVELRREPGPEADALRRLATGTAAPTGTAAATGTAAPTGAGVPTSSSVIVLAGDDAAGTGSRLARAHGLGRLAGGSTVEAILAEIATPVVVVPGRLGELAAAQAARAAADDTGLHDGPGRNGATAARTDTDAELDTGVDAVGTVGSVAARVASAERRDGGDAGRRHIVAPPGAEPRGVGRIQANDHANLASVARPSARTAALAAVALGALALVVSLVAGAGTMVATMVTIGAAIVGLVLGGLGGLYRNVVMNRDVIDLRGAEDAPAAARTTEHAATTRAAEGVGYVEEHDARLRDAPSARPGGDRAR